jgi:hypothetical protein
VKKGKPALSSLVAAATASNEKQFSRNKYKLAAFLVAFVMMIAGGVTSYSRLLAANSVRKIKTK